MKSKNRILFLFMAMLIACVIACNDESPNGKNDNLPPDGNGSTEFDKEALYRYQTNKDMILFSLIQYDSKENKYFLDVTEKDLEKLGITIEAYEDEQKQVEQMNQVNLERQ